MLLVGQLPWQSLKAQQSAKCKRNTTNKELCKGLPNNFVKYFDCCSSLVYDDTPDYDYLKELIRNACVPEGKKEDVVADPGRSVERKKSRHKKQSEAVKKPSPTKNPDANTLSYKAMWDEISSAAVKKIMSIKKRLPDMLATLMQ